MTRTTSSSCQETPSSSSEELDKCLLLKPVKNYVCVVECSSVNVFKETSPEHLIIINTFPWLSEFLNLVRTELITNMKGLLKLMDFYYKNALIAVNECYNRTIRATKLKKALSDALKFFYMTYCSLTLPNDHSSYLQKMSDLMALYLDMEIKSSRTGMESTVKIASRITSSLYVYFGKSPGYIIDTIFKVKFIAKNVDFLLDLIFRRVLRDCDASSIDGIAYVRYLLAFKMWKSITKEPNEKQAIVKLACSKLRPPPGFLKALNNRKEFRGFLPKLPKNYPDTTDFFMKVKFSARDRIKVFFRLADNPLAFSSWQPLDTDSYGIDFEKDKSGVGNLIKNIWTDLSPKPTLFDESANKRSTRHNGNKGRLGMANKYETKKVNTCKVVEIINLVENDSQEVQGDHVSSVQKDLDDLVITSSLSEEDKAKHDEIYNEKIDSCVKSDGDVEDSHMGGILTHEALVSSNHSNLYDAYEDPVASTSCIKEGFDDLINDAFPGNLIDYGHPMETLSDVAAAVKEELLMLDSKGNSAEMVTSTSPQRKSLRDYSISQVEKDDKFNYDTISFSGNQLLLIQDDEITKSGCHDFQNTEKENPSKCEEKLLSEESLEITSPTIMNKVGMAKFKTYSELKQNLLTPKSDCNDQDFINLALSSKCDIREAAVYPPTDPQGQCLGSLNCETVDELSEYPKKPCEKLPEISLGELADEPPGELVEEPPGKAPKQPLPKAIQEYLADTLPDTNSKTTSEGTLGYKIPKRKPSDNHEEELIPPLKKSQLICLIDILKRQPVEEIDILLKKQPEKKMLKRNAKEKPEGLPEKVLTDKCAKRICAWKPDGLHEFPRKEHITENGKPQGVATLEESNKLLELQEEPVKPELKQPEKFNTIKSTVSLEDMESADNRIENSIP